MKYIDADLLKSKLKDVATEFKTRNYYLDNSEQAVGYENALIDFEQLVDSPQQEQKSVAERFARIVRGNLIGIDKEVQQKFENLYFEVTGNKMYGGTMTKYIDAEKLKTHIEAKMEILWDKLPAADKEHPTDIELRDLGMYMALEGLIDDLDSLQQEQPTLSDNLKLNMTRTKLELNEIETLTHLVRAKAVEPGPYQGLYKGILSKLNKMFDEEYAEREKEMRKRNESSDSCNRSDRRSLGCGKA